MTQLSNQTYAIFNQVLDVFELANEDKTRYQEKFEQMLLVKFAAAIVKKLPENEGKEISELANLAVTPEQKNQLQEKLKTWLNPEEIKSLWQKVADQVFEDFLKVVYNVATEPQKTQLETMFPQEVLKE